MTVFGIVTDAGQLVGVAGFAIAAFACLLAAVRIVSGERSLWLVLAAVQLACALEAALGWRYRLHEAVIVALQGRGLYFSRTPMQAALIFATLVLSALCGTFAWRLLTRRQPPLAGAVAGTTAAVATFAIETISLHAVDTFMYAEVGPIDMLSWLWAAAAAIVTLSALAALWQRRRERPGPAA